MTSASDVPRYVPFVWAPEHGSDREVLLGFLAQQRSLVHWKLADARDEDLLRVGSASGLTPRGVLSHLTNVERWWWRDVVAGQDGLAYDWTDADPDGEMHIGPEVPLAELLAQYAAECARCDEVLAGIDDLDATALRKPVSVRWVILHLVEETSRHLGHLDLLRELADGSVGVVPKRPDG